MNAQRLTGMACLALALVLPAGALAQTFPVVRGALEFQAGVSGVILPEETDGTFGVHPMGKVGFFIAEGFELQGEVTVRVWPLGAIAPNAFDVGGGIAWYPNLGTGNRNLFLTAAAGVQSEEDVEGNSTWDPFGRGSIGFKIPISGLGFLSSFHLSMEFREEVHFKESTDFVSGLAMGFSYFL